MKALDPACLTSLIRIFHTAFPENPEYIRHEHSAQHVHGTLAQDIAALTEGLGYTLIRETGEVAFLVHGEHRVELIPKGEDWDEHEAWAVSTPEGFKHLAEVMTEDGAFSRGEGYMGDEMYYQMFTHKSTSAVIQIIWRDKPLFPGVFPATCG